MEEFSPLRKEESGVIVTPSVAQIEMARQVE